MPILTPTDQLHRFLISRTDNLGDVICTLPLALAIKEQIPEANVAYMVKPYTASIVRRIKEIDEVLTLTKLRGGLKLMKVYNPDAIIFAKPEFQLAFEAVMARVDVRIGTGYRWYSGLFTRWVYDHRRKGEHHEAWYGVQMLGPLFGNELSVRMPEFPVLPQAEVEAKKRLSELQVTEEYIVVHPGSRGSANDYPPGKYSTVINALLEANNHLNVLITVGPEEEQLGEHVLSGVADKSRAVIAGGLSLDGLSELLRNAKLFIGGSSGPAHLAALTGAPVVALYPGLPPMWPARWHPIGSRVRTLVPKPEEPLDTATRKGLEIDNIVGRISPDRVIAACQDMLEGKFVETEGLIL